MTNAERLKLINDKLTYNRLHGIYPGLKQELSKAVFGTTQFIYRNYPVTYLTVNDNKDIRNFFKKIEAFLKIDLKTNEPIKTTKKKSFLKDYVYVCLNRYGNTTINHETFTKYGEEKILNELADKGYICEMTKRIDESKQYKYLNHFYTLHLKRKI